MQHLDIVNIQRVAFGSLSASKSVGIGSLLFHFDRVVQNVEVFREEISKITHLFDIRTPRSRSLSAQNNQTAISM